MNKPFKGIKVPFKGPEKISYRNGGKFKAGDLVTKRIAGGYDDEGNAIGYRSVYGVVGDGPEDCPHFAMVQWSEDYEVPVCCNPMRLKLVSHRDRIHRLFV